MGRRILVNRKFFEKLAQENVEISTNPARLDLNGELGFNNMPNYTIPNICRTLNAYSAQKRDPWHNVCQKVQKTLKFHDKNVII